MYAMEQSLDISNTIPKGVSFTVGKKEYELVYHFGNLKLLSDTYGSVQKAIDALNERKDPYTLVLNFLYAALHERYKLSKSKIEEWIGPGSVNLLYNLVFSAILLAFGETDSGEDDGGSEEQGEA